MVLRGSAITVLGFGFQKVLRLVSNLILTRLLAPEIFGLLTLAQLVTGTLLILSDVGTQASVIRSDRGEDREFLQTAWTIQVLRGLGIAFVACLLSWPVSRLYDQPVLFPLICVLGLGVAIRSCKSISIATMNRKLFLGRLTVVETVVQVIAIVTTAVMAWLLQSVWAIAIGTIVSAILNVIMSFKLFPPFPHRFRLEKSSVGEMLGFGRWILLGTLFHHLGGRGITAVQGLLLPIETIGFLSLSNLLAWAPGEIIARVLSSAGFPALSQVGRDRPQDMARALRKIRIGLICMVLPVFVPLSFLGQFVVDLLYDPRYAQAGVFLSLMAINSAIATLSMPYQNALLAVGDSRSHAAVMTSSAALRIAFVMSGYMAGGVIGMIVGIGIANLCVHCVSAYLAWKRGHAGLRLDAAVLSLLGLLYVYTLNVVAPGFL